MNSRNEKKKVHFMPGDGKGWALDEDLRQMRQALKEVVCETNLVQAEIIHTPFWQGLNAVAPEILKKAFVIAHADNPPFFYLNQPEFFLGQQQVDLWVARSNEALEQFQALGLPAKHIPYTIDPSLFFPITDKKRLREKYHIPLDSYIIANFHRDTEGVDLITPKLQKAPELMLAILKQLKSRGANIHVLLAGPRRHWLRKELLREKIPYTFVGKEGVDGDDFGINILNRSTLNELTNAADLYLIPSRWEGGPQSVMEAAACRCKVLSTPLGIARDILEPSSLFTAATEAVEQIFEDIKNDTLRATLQPQWERWHASHTTATMEQGLRDLYKELPGDAAFQKKYQDQQRRPLQRSWKQARHLLKIRLTKTSLPKKIGWNHQAGESGDLDEVMLGLGQALKALGIKIEKATGHGIEIIGWPTPELPVAPASQLRMQWIVPEMPWEYLQKEALLVAPSVQDIINLRSEGCTQPAVVIPFPLKKEKTSDELLVVDTADRHASIKIWRAMAAGQPVVYPESSAYYWQVFHGGLSYQHKSNLSSIIASAQENAVEMQSLSRPLSMSSAKKAFKKLLLELAFIQQQA